MRLFLAPHNDDETLFGALSIQREQPLVVVVFEAYLQGKRGALITPQQRRNETLAAMKILGVHVEFMGLRDDVVIEPTFLANDFCLKFKDRQIESVFAPAIEIGGNVHHNLVGQAANLQWPGIVRHYTTYTSAGKSRGYPVPKQPDWIAKKLRALACYESQIAEPSTQEHFMRDIYEYYAE
jgi:LmbE family N-acetylglucosaminyl deacetylase